MERFDVWLVMKNPNNGRVVENLGLCTIISPNELNDLPRIIKTFGCLYPNYTLRQ